MSYNTELITVHAYPTELTVYAYPISDDPVYAYPISDEVVCYERKMMNQCFTPHETMIQCFAGMTQQQRNYRNCEYVIVCNPPFGIATNDFNKISDNKKKNNLDAKRMRIVKNKNEKNTNSLVIRRANEYKSRNQPLRKGGGNRTPL